MKTCKLWGLNENLKTCKLRGLQWKLENASPQNFLQVSTQVNGSPTRRNLGIFSLYLGMCRVRPRYNKPHSHGPDSVQSLTSHTRDNYEKDQKKIGLIGTGASPLCTGAELFQIWIHPRDFWCIFISNGLTSPKWSPAWPTQRLKLPRVQVHRVTIFSMGLCADTGYV